MRNSTTQDRLLLYLSNEGINQNEFAKRTGIDKGVISRLINGEMEPSVKNLVKIADNTGISPSWLLGYGLDEIIERI